MQGRAGVLFCILASALLEQLTEEVGGVNFSEGREVELKDLARQRVFAVT